MSLIIVSAFTALPTKAASTAFDLYGSSTSGWGLAAKSMTSPGPTMTVTQGDTVSLNLTSMDELSHKFFVDYNNNGQPDADEPTSPSFTGTVSFEFAADRAGTFTYRCAFHPTVMYGTFIVQTVSPAPQPFSLTSLDVIALLFIGCATAAGAISLMILILGFFDYVRRRRLQTHNSDHE